MDDEELYRRVRELREAGRSPKQIARALDVRPTVVARAVRTVAERQAAVAPRPPVVGCWVSPGWETGLEFDRRPDWPVTQNPDDGIGGLVTVLVARRHRWDKIVASSYLVDVYCLGVKNTAGPEIMDEVDFTEWTRTVFLTYDAPGLPAPLDLAQHLVLGAVEYAGGLGFEPHPDFAQTRGELEPWQGPSAITFGYLGKPSFVQGPHDNPRRVMRTLDASVGSGNYDFTVTTSDPWRGLTV